MKIVSKSFPKVRGTATVDYVFQTFDDVLTMTDRESALGKLAVHFKSVIEHGIPPAVAELTGVSELPKLICKVKKVDDPITALAEKSGAAGNGNRQHDILQEYFLKNDPHTIATEIPVWNKDALGHIDAIRVAGNRVQVLDYKPNARKEKKAASQILRYRKMLSRNTGIDLGRIVAGYFDEKNYYQLSF